MSAADDDDARADGDAGCDRTVAKRDRLHPNFLPCNVPADARRIRFAESASGSAKIRPKVVADGDSSKFRRLLFGIQGRDDDGDDDD